MPAVNDIAEHLRALEIDVLTDDLSAYGRDETMDLFCEPGLVVRPRSTPEVSEVLRLAERENIPVTPRGGGTGKAGGAIPVGGGIVLSLERMDRIREIDRANRYLPFLGKLVEILKSEQNRTRILEASDFDEVAEVLRTGA